MSKKKTLKGSIQMSEKKILKKLEDEFLDRVRSDSDYGKLTAYFFGYWIETTPEERKDDKEGQRIFLIMSEPVTMISRRGEDRTPEDYKKSFKLMDIIEQKIKEYFKESRGEVKIEELIKLKDKSVPIPSDLVKALEIIQPPSWRREVILVQTPEKEIYNIFNWDKSKVLGTITFINKYVPIDELKEFISYRYNLLLAIIEIVIEESYALKEMAFGRVVKISRKKLLYLLGDTPFIRNNLHNVMLSLASAYYFMKGEKWGEIGHLVSNVQWKNEGRELFYYVELSYGCSLFKEIKGYINRYVLEDKEIKPHYIQIPIPMLQKKESIFANYIMGQSNDYYIKISTCLKKFLSPNEFKKQTMWHLGIKFDREINNLTGIGYDWTLHPDSYELIKRLSFRNYDDDKMHKIGFSGLTENYRVLRELGEVFIPRKALLDLKIKFIRPEKKREKQKINKQEDADYPYQRL